MEREYKSRSVWFALAVTWMIVIFCFSHQEADNSSQISGTLAYQVVEGIDLAAGMSWGEDERLLYAKAIEHSLRKAAHMTEYAVLACIFLGNFSCYPLTKKRRYAWAQVLTALYAATDEFHQLFINGRSGEMKDVAIDSAGAFLGLLLAWAVSFVYNKARHQKRKR